MLSFHLFINLRDPTLCTDSFRRLFKTRLFSEYTYSALDVNIALYASYKSRITGTYLLNVYVGFVNVGLCLLSTVTRAVN